MPNAPVLIWLLPFHGLTKWENREDIHQKETAIHMWLIQQGEFLELRYSGADGKRKQSSPTKRRKTYSADFCSIECILVPQQLTKRYQLPQTIKMMMIYKKKKEIFSCISLRILWTKVTAQLCFGTSLLFKVLWIFAPFFSVHN